MYDFNVKYVYDNGETQEFMDVKKINVSEDEMFITHDDGDNTTICRLDKAEEIVFKANRD